MIPTSWFMQTRITAAADFKTRNRESRNGESLKWGIFKSGNLSNGESFKWGIFKSGDLPNGESLKAGIFKMGNL